MIVSPLQQLQTVDAPTNGLTKPLIAGSPLGEGAFSALLATSTSLAGNEIANIPTDISLPETILTGAGIGAGVGIATGIGIGAEAEAEAELPPFQENLDLLASSGSPQPLVATSDIPNGATKQDAILSATIQHGAKIAFNPLQQAAIAVTEQLPENAALEKQAAKNVTVQTSPTTVIANQTNAPIAKPLELPNTILSQMAATTDASQNGSQTKPNTANVTTLASNAQGMDTGGQLVEPATQNTSTSTTNLNASAPLANAAMRQPIKLEGQSNPAPRGTPNATINTADIAVQVARQKADGNNQFTIRLSPESMGTVTIRLNVGDNAKLTAQMQVEKPETLALLQKDLAGLEKALKAQGFNTSTSDISIALKSATTAMRMGDVMGENVGDQRQGQGQNSTQNQQAAQTNQTSTNSASQSTAAQNAGNQNAQSGGVDRGVTTNNLPSSDMGGFQQSSQGRGEQSQMASDQEFQGHPDDTEIDEQDTSTQDMMENIANAYRASSILVGMSSQVDLSI